MHRALVSAGLLIAALAGGAAAQSPRSIDPGMSRAQVLQHLGPPAATRTSGTATYLFYKNGCVRACGMDDVVMLEGDSVVDAIFRSTERQYTGRSSSPRAVSAVEAAHARRSVIQAGAPDTASAATPVPASDSVVAPAGNSAASVPPTPAAPTPSPVPVARPNMPLRPAGTAETGSLRIKVKGDPAARKPVAGDTTGGKRAAGAAGSDASAKPDTDDRAGGLKPEDS